MAYIPEDARWYLADIVLELKIEGDRRNVVPEQELREWVTSKKEQLGCFAPIEPKVDIPNYVPEAGVRMREAGFTREKLMMMKRVLKELGRTLDDEKTQSSAR